MSGSSTSSVGRRVTVACPFCGTLNRVDLTRLADRPRCAECKRPILLDRPIAVSDASFERSVAEAEVPVLVDFYADWCGPCKVMAPVLDEVAQQRAGHLLVLKLDTERNPVTPQRFGIRGIPTVILFRNGREAARQTGAVPKAALERMIA